MLLLKRLVLADSNYAFRTLEWFIPATNDVLRLRVTPPPLFTFLSWLYNAFHS
jgi:hypothetical protein